MTSRLEQPALGVSGPRTVVGLGFLAVVVAVVVASILASAVTVGGQPLDERWSGFDDLSAMAIAVAWLSLAASLAYAVWNGGPALAAATAVGPFAVGEVLSGRYVLDLDVAIALAVAGLAAVLGVLAGRAHREGRVLPRRIPVTAALLVSGWWTVTAFAAGRFWLAGPEHAATWFRPFGVLVALGAVGLVLCWTRTHQ